MTTGVQTLFPGLPKAVELYRDGPVVGHDKAWNYICNTGRKWVGKPCDKVELLAESMAALCSPYVGGPLPDAKTADRLGEVLWLSEYVEFAEKWSFSPASCYKLTNVKALGIVAALDVLMCNIDRHEANVLVWKSESEGYFFKAIDFGKGQMAMPGTFEPTQPLAPNGIYLSVPKRFISSDARAAAKTLSKLPPHAIDRVINGAAQAASAESEVMGLIRENFTERLRILETLTDDFLGGLP